MKAFFRTTGSFSYLFARVALGVVMLPHGSQKVLGLFGGQGYEKTLEAFTRMGFLPILVIALMVSEFLGSIFLIAGFMTRLWALAIGISMATCAYLNHFKNGFFMNWFGAQQGEGFEFHILVVGLALCLVVGGGGAFSLDKKIAGGKK
ncbi:MAG: DoxX family protein [Thermodesulfovibrionales bacterium]